MQLIRVRANCNVMGMFHDEQHEIELNERVFKLIQSGHLTWLIRDEELGEVVDGG